MAPPPSTGRETTPSAATAKQTSHVKSSVEIDIPSPEQKDIKVLLTRARRSCHVNPPSQQSQFRGRREYHAIPNSTPWDRPEKEGGRQKFGPIDGVPFDIKANEGLW